jgi:hypothetical protein
LECLECGSDYFSKYFLFLKIIFDINPPLGGNYISRRLVRLFHHEGLANDTCFQRGPIACWQSDSKCTCRKMIKNYISF